MCRIAFQCIFQFDRSNRNERTFVVSLPVECLVLCTWNNYRTHLMFYDRQFYRFQFSFENRIHCEHFVFCSLFFTLSMRFRRYHCCCIHFYSYYLFDCRLALTWFCYWTVFFCFAFYFSDFRRLFSCEPRHANAIECLRNSRRCDFIITMILFAFERSVLGF